MTKFLWVIILVAGFSVASAEDPKLKVDLATVVSTGVVVPVNGMSSAGQPDEAAFGIFAEQGFTTVIDLRTAGEDRGLDEATVVADLGMEYISLPIGRDDITFDSARSLDQLIEASDGPVLVHCGSANRVGALLALSKSLNGADNETALDFGRKGGMTSLETQVEKALTEK